MAEYSAYASVVTSHPAEPQIYRCRLLGISHYLLSPAVELRVGVGICRFVPLPTCFRVGDYTLGESGLAYRRHCNATPPIFCPGVSSLQIQRRRRLPELLLIVAGGGPMLDGWRLLIEARNAPTSVTI